MANNPSSSLHKPTSETSSRCVTDGVTTAHNFEVIGYSLLEGMGAGEFVTSSTFNVGDYDWNIMIYPDGMEEEDKACYVSVFFAVCGGATGVRAKYTFSLLEKDGGV
jgi:speckle-type POZ protein